MNTTKRAVIDRVEETRWAVLLVGEGAREVVVPVTSLPSKAKPGMWLNVELEGDQLISVEIDEAYTQEVRERVEKKRVLLQKRGRKPSPDSE